PRCRCRGAYQRLPAASRAIPPLPQDAPFARVETGWSTAPLRPYEPSCLCQPWIEPRNACSAGNRESTGGRTSWNCLSPVDYHRIKRLPPPDSIKGHEKVFAGQRALLAIKCKSKEAGLLIVVRHQL